MKRVRKPRSIRVRGFLSTTESEAERAQAARGIVESLLEARQPDPESPEALRAGRRQTPLAQSAEPLTYREAGLLLESADGVFDGKLGHGRPPAGEVRNTRMECAVVDEARAPRMPTLPSLDDGDVTRTASDQHKPKRKSVCAPDATAHEKHTEHPR